MESQSRDQIHIIEEEPPTKRQRQNDNHNISSAQQPRVQDSEVFISTGNFALEMQCPVCYSVVFEKPLFCNEGHLHCSPCQAKLTHCSICRSSQTNCRNIVLERLVLPILQKMSFHCQNQPYGCTYQDKPKLLNKHSILCQYTLVKCISHKTNHDCKWTGCLNDYLSHLKTGQLKDANYCAGAMRSAAVGKFHSFYFVDNCIKSSFSYNTDKYWPLLLTSTQLLPFFIHVIIHRTQQGQWNFSVCSLASEQLCKKLSVVLQILPVNGKRNAADASIQHTFIVKNASLNIKKKILMDDVGCQSMSIGSVLFKLRVYVYVTSDDEEEGTGGLRNILSTNDL